MSSKVRKSLSLKRNTIERILNYAEQENMTESSVVDLAVEQFLKDKEVEHALLVKTIANVLDQKLEPFKEDLNRIRVTSNVIDRDTKMMLEFWNHYFVVNEFNMLATTEEHKTNELKQAENLIKKRISENRQRKLDWESKRNHNKNSS